ncbi:hypothetical protein [Isoptericola sp. NPDC057653]|uniref:hypothetical protein n=1 Tax=Isoptericola sp. NPDC057653 TaxID=3346195 RepID=UPI0036BF7F69
MTSRVQDAISWRRPRRQRRGARASAGAATGLVRAAVDLAMSIASGDAPAGDLSGLAAEPPRVPRDPAQPVAELPCVVVGGSPSWAAATAADRPRLWATAPRFWVELPGTGGDVEVDRATLALRSLAVAPGQEGPVTLDTRCDATLAAPGLEIVVQGSWLAVAWLGHLAGWRDPGLPEPGTAVGR